MISGLFNGGRKRLSSGIRQFATMNNVNKTLMGVQSGLKKLGSGSRFAQDVYNRLDPVIGASNTQLGQNVSNVLNTLGKL